MKELNEKMEVAWDHDIGTLTKGYNKICGLSTSVDPAMNIYLVGKSQCWHPTHTVLFFPSSAHYSVAFSLSIIENKECLILLT